jgi:hypothetical protein
MLALIGVATLIVGLTQTAFAGRGRGPGDGTCPNLPGSEVETTTIEATVDAVALPVIYVTDSEGVERDVHAGSIRYWDEMGFDVSEGDSLTITGFEVENPLTGDVHFVASSIVNNTTGQVIELRDEYGMPLWRRGPFGRRWNSEGRTR